MEKKTLSYLIALLGVVILLIALVEIGNSLLPASTFGSVTVTDEIGDTWYSIPPDAIPPEGLPEVPFLDIVKATIEKNETSLSITIKVNGDIPNQTEEPNATYAYTFRDFIALWLEGDEWTPELGHPEYYYKVDYSGDNFPGSYLVDHEGRTVQLFLDLKTLREQGYKTDVMSDVFIWTAGTLYWGQIAGPYDTISSAYFPDFFSFYRPLIHILLLAIIVIGAVVWILKTFIWKH